MQNNLLHTILIGTMVLVLFGVGECLHHFAKLKAEYTRKLIHIGTGFITLLCPLLIDNHWYVLLLCASFAVLLSLSIQMGFLKSINNIGRKSFGSISYAVSVYGCFLVFVWQKSNIFFYMPMLILAIADPLAALIGKRWEYGKFKIRKEVKTISGAAMFFITACIVSVACIYFHGGYSLVTIIWVPLVISAVSTMAEALTEKGLDNITIPLVVVAIMLIGKYYEVGLWSFNN